MSFNTVNYLLFEKQKKELDAELLADFSPFLVTKSFSFYNNGKLVDYINDTLNTYGNIFKNKEDQFRFFDNIIIKQRKGRINYIKNAKIDKTESLPIPEFYSAREIDIMNSQSKYVHE